MTSVSARMMKGSAWISAGRAIINGLALLSTVLLGRLLTPSDFGLIGLATTILMVATSVTELSLSSALVRHEAPTDSHFDAAWTLNALRGLVLGLLFAAAGIPVANLYDDQRLVLVMVVLGFGVFLGGLSNPRIIMLQRNLIFWQDVLLNVVQKLTGVIASVLIAYFYQSYWALVIGTLVTQLTYVVISYFIMPFRPSISFSHLKELLSFSLWLTAGQIVNTLNWRFDHLLVGKGLSIDALGHYTVGSNFAQIPTRESTAPLSKIVFPGFSSIRHDRARLASAYQRAQSFITAVALPVGFGAALVADPLIRLTMGDKWEPIIFVVQVLSSVFALQTLGSMADPLGMAQGETRLLFVRNVQMLLIRSPLIVAGMLLGGLKGVVVARVASGLVAIWFAMRLVERFTGLSLRDQLAANVRAFASVTVMVCGTVAVSPYLPQGSEPTLLVGKIALTALLAGTLYCGTTMLLWIMTSKPSGPERELQQLIAKVLTKLRAA